MSDEKNLNAQSDISSDDDAAFEDSVVVQGDYVGGDKIVWSFIQDTIPKYWMYIIIHEIYEDFELLEPLIKLFLNFGSSLADTAELIMPMKGSYKWNREIVLSLDWKDETQKQLATCKNPYFLVLPCDIADFSPK